jgi:hypothetical protein
MRPAATAAKRSSHDRLSPRPTTCTRSSISSRACWCASAGAAGLLRIGTAVNGVFFMSLALPVRQRRNRTARDRTADPSREPARRSRFALLVLGSCGWHVNERLESEIELESGGTANPGKNG